MAIARSKVTAQGQISVVRRAGRFSSAAMHEALFGGRTPKARTLEELKAGIRRYVRKHSRSGSPIP